LAVLTVLATLPLLFLGAEVTSKQAGMADPVGYRPPWEILQLLSDAIGLGLQIEYSHRLAGFTVGICAIVLAVAMRLTDPRRGVRWLGFVALALVCIQGLFGKYRVDLNALFGQNLALIHGCFAQLVIATLVAVALVTSRGWINDHAEPHGGSLAPRADKARRWSLITMLIVYAQLVTGGVMRHRDFLLGSRLHLVGAFLVLGAVIWLMKLARESERRDSLARSVHVLCMLLTFQVLLGIEAWIFRAEMVFVPNMRLPVYADWLRSAHYVLGTLIFATSVVIALKANRRAVVLESPSPARTLEGAL
jgi:cytochrome c oxidase assembly protein subunit 15